MAQFICIGLYWPFTKLPFNLPKLTAVPSILTPPTSRDFSNQADCVWLEGMWGLTGQDISFLLPWVNKKYN